MVSSMDKQTLGTFYMSLTDGIENLSNNEYLADPVFLRNT